MENRHKFLYRQFLCVLPICCQFFMVGLSRAWIAPILKEASEPHSELPLTSEESSWMASLSYITPGLSPLFLSVLVDRLGRNPIVVFTATINFGMWIAVYCSRDVFVHYAVRLMCGFSDGFLNALSSIYVCENCSANFRGTLFTVVVLFLFAGQFIAFVLASFRSYNLVAIANALFGLAALLSTFLLVEPAQYFLMKNDKDRAEKNFARLRDMNDPATVKEFEAIKKNVQEEKSRTCSLSHYRSREVFRSLRLVLIMLSLGAGLGWGAVVAFVTKLFSNSSALTANQFSVLFGLFQFVCVAVSSTIMDRFDRRSIFLRSNLFICIIHAGIFALYRLQSAYEIPYFDLLLFVMVTSFACVCSMFVLPLLGILRGELLPQSMKMMGTGLSTLAMAVVVFTNSRTFLPIAEAFGVEVNFAIYSIVALLLVVYAYFDLPETRGKTLVEIQEILKGVRIEIQ